MRRGLGLPSALVFKRSELGPLRMLPSKVGVCGVPGVRDEPETDEEAEDGGRGRAERADPELEIGGVEVLLIFEAFVDVVRTDEGEPFG